MKKIIASLTAVATLLSLSATAFAAVDPGSTNGKKEETVKVEEGKDVEVTLAEGITVAAPAGAFTAGSEVKFVVDIQKADPADVAIPQETITGKVDGAKIETKIDITATVDDKAVQPADGKKVTVTVAYDGVSNIVAYIDDKNAIEWIKLNVSEDKKTASFETSHFSAFYMVSVAADKVDSLLGDASGDTNKPGTDKGDNKPTGVAIAIIPAAIAAAAVVVSKKRK